jgi:hypothetical protein
MRRALVGLVALCLAAGVPTLPTASAAACGDLSGTCGVTGETTHFHGILAVTGVSWVFDASASAENGCDDCSWSMVPACVTEQPDQPDTLCADATAAPTCDPGQVLYRLYLTTAAFVDRDEGVLCIGGDHQPVPVSNISDDDVKRYLDNVTPPDLVLGIRPHRATLAGLVTYFRATVPADVAPSAFGGPDVTELITITPTEVRWHWGDHESSNWSTPGDLEAHRYLSGGIATGSVVTRWHATYTVTYAGRTFGPYDADRDITRTQGYRLAVRTSSPTLVSH